MSGQQGLRPLGAAYATRDLRLVKWWPGRKLEG